MSARRTRMIVAVATAVFALLVSAPLANAATANDTTQFAVTAGTLAFGTAPDVPNLPALTLSGQTQTLNATMNSFSTSDATGNGSGWNVSVIGDTSGGKSAVFKQYCPNATCGSDAGPGYVAGGFTLPADSLTWKTGAASWTSAAPRPAYQCNVSPWCFIDNAAPTKVVSASTSVALGAWTSSGTSTTSTRSTRRA